MLSASDPVPTGITRILVAGVSGAGKTTLAGRIGAELQVPHTELDSLYHGPSWTPRVSFVADVEALVLADAWVTEWQYAVVRRRLLERAQLLVWLDPPFLTVTLPRVIRRTVRRRRRNEVLWNGNVEPPLRTFFTDHDHIVRWAWQTRNKYRALMPDLIREFPELPVVRLRSQREVDHWMRESLPLTVS